MTQTDTQTDTQTTRTIEALRKLLAFAEAHDVDAYAFGMNTSSFQMHKAEFVRLMSYDAKIHRSDRNHFVYSRDGIELALVANGECSDDDEGYITVDDFNSLNVQD